jgi:hypothetical protein
MLEFDAFYVLEFALFFGEYPIARLILGSKTNQRIQKPVSLFTLSLFISFGHICCSFAAGVARPLYTLLIRAFYIGFRISSVDASTFTFLSSHYHLGYPQPLDSASRDTSLLRHDSPRFQPFDLSKVPFSVVFF